MHRRRRKSLDVFFSRFCENAQVTLDCVRILSVLRSASLSSLIRIDGLEATICAWR